jgi:GNAT superfamily N-acetyltransferase
LLAIQVVCSDADLEDMIQVQALVRPEWQPKVDTLRFNLEANPELTHLVARVGEEPVACGFVEPWGARAQGDVAVAPARRRRGVGYAFLQASGDRAFHGLTATRRDWRHRGVATALKQAEIAAAKRAGLKRLLTESEERNEPMRRLNEKLGFVPAPEWSTVVMRGPVAP